MFQGREIIKCGPYESRHGRIVISRIVEWVKRIGQWESEKVKGVLGNPEDMAKF